jgi:PAS domain S-box-containing protein
VRIQTKIILLLSLITLLFLSAFMLMRYSQRSREEIIIRTRVLEKNTLFDKLLKLKTASLELFVYDFSGSDQMVSFISSRNKDWGLKHIDPFLSGFNIQAVWIFDVEYATVYFTRAPDEARIQAADLPRFFTSRQFMSHYFSHFFITTPNGVMEIQTAPIQPAGDRQRETAPCGFLVAGRLWNRDYVDELSILTESTIAITPLKNADESIESSYTYNYRTGTFSFSRVFYDWNQNPLLQVSVRSESPMLKEFNLMTSRQMWLFAVFAFAIIITIFYFLLRWVNIPLAMISRSLKTEDPKIIHSLDKKRNEFGNLARLITTFFHQKDELVREVSERKRAEEALSESNEALVALIEASPLAIVSIAAGQTVKMWNPAAERMFGWKAEEVLGRPLPFVPPDKQRDVQVMIERVMQGNIFTDFEIRCNKKDNTPIELTISSAPLRDETGTVSGIMAVIHDTTMNRQLIREIIEISGREQIRIGQDLHDGLSQHLTGIAFLSKVLEQKLAAQSSDETVHAKDITRLMNQAIEMTRGLARGLSPVAMGEDGLQMSLRELADTVTGLFSISCLFHGDNSVVIPSTTTATHLFRIAQEAVNNAIKHGRAQHIIIALSPRNDKTVLSIEDDGSGFAVPPDKPKGMGLHIMSYRAKMIGASLSVEARPGGGTAVTCAIQNTASMEG